MLGTQIDANNLARDWVSLIYDGCEPDDYYPLGIENDLDHCSLISMQGAPPFQFDLFELDDVPF